MSNLTFFLHLCLMFAVYKFTRVLMSKPSDDWGQTVHFSLSLESFKELVTKLNEINPVRGQMIRVNDQVKGSDKLAILIK